MRSVVLLLLLSAACVAAHGRAPHASTRVPARLTIDQGCREGFSYREGWCVSLGPSMLTFQQAVDHCKTMAAFSPSIHSSQDLNFWKGSAVDLTPSFWLDAACPYPGSPNEWRDRSLTDYYGPKGELQSCVAEFGFQMHSSGFFNASFSSEAPALCVYPVDPEPEPEDEDPALEYCSCDSSTGPPALDVAIIVDVSRSMEQEKIDWAVDAVVRKLTRGSPRPRESNVALFTVAEKIQVPQSMESVRDGQRVLKIAAPIRGGDLSMMAEAVVDASAHLKEKGVKRNRDVIIMIGRSSEAVWSYEFYNATENFKKRGGVLAVIDFTALLTTPGAYLESMATRGYYFPSGLKFEISTWDCDASCFCPPETVAFSFVDFETRRETPAGGCYRIARVPKPYDDAEIDCSNYHRDAFVATDHDESKNFFMLSIFPNHEPYWLGLRRYDSDDGFTWADGSLDGYTYWGPKQPVDGQDCVFGLQTNGFKSPWFTDSCEDTKLAFACQSRPCDAVYDCFD